MSNSELLAEMKKLNRNIEWLKKREMKQQEPSASAAEVMKITGWTKDRLKGERERGTIKSKRINTKFRYDLNSLPEIYKQKVIYATDQLPQPQLVRV